MPIGSSIGAGGWTVAHDCAKVRRGKRSRNNDPSFRERIWAKG